MKAFLMCVLCVLLALGGVAQTTDTTTVNKTVITGNEFNRLLQSIQNQSSDSLKVGALKETFINTNYFNTAQIRKLLALIPKDSNKLALARSAYDRVTDQNNFIQLADLFESDIYQKEFTMWVNNPDK